MMAADRDTPVSPEEAAALFDDLEDIPALLLAVSGGPDSTALMWLLARWRAGLERGPKLVAVTVDHGLRPEAAKEARAVARLARKLGLAHRILRWTGKKPSTGLQEAARTARYCLLADAARRADASAILTAHTLDDQAETVLIRLTRGSGLAGLGAMRRVSVIPGRSRQRANPESRWRPSADIWIPGPRASRVARNDGEGPLLVRPLLTIPKSRLIATLHAETIPFAEDPSNRDPRFTRVRLRGLMPQLAQEGLDARRLAVLAGRSARAEEALGLAADAAYEMFGKQGDQRIEFDAGEGLNSLPDEIALRLLGRAIVESGDEGPVELGKLEALHSALLRALREGERLRRSLAGAVVTLDRTSLTIERAPPRRSRTLTTGRAASRQRPRMR